MPDNQAIMANKREPLNIPATRPQIPTRSLPLELSHRLLERHGIGSLLLELPSGAGSLIGASTGPAQAHLALRSYAALWKVARRGALGFAESYMAGDFDTVDLKALFEFYLANEPAITRCLPRVNETRRLDCRFHIARQNSRDGSRRNIGDHYDLGNAFYSLWLDPSMLYSSGIYGKATDTLEAAQAEKIRRILDGLELHGGETMLEIGCGWGALACAAPEKRRAGRRNHNLGRATRGSECARRSSGPR